MILENETQKQLAQKYARKRLAKRLIKGKIDLPTLAQLECGNKELVVAHYFDFGGDKKSPRDYLIAWLIENNKIMDGYPKRYTDEKENLSEMLDYLIEDFYDIHCAN